MAQKNYIVKISVSKNIKHKIVQENPTNTLKMLDYSQREWLYRHQHFWNISIKLFLFNLAFTMLPFISGAFGITFDLKKFSAFIFPIVGAILAVACYLITMGEAKRLDEVGGVKYKINKQMNILYQYNKYHKTNSNKRKLVYLMPMIILVFQLLTVIIVFIAIKYDMHT